MFENEAVSISVGLTLNVSQEAQSRSLRNSSRRSGGSGAKSSSMSIEIGCAVKLKRGPPRQRQLCVVKAPRHAQRFLGPPPDIRRRWDTETVRYSEGPTIGYIDGAKNSVPNLGTRSYLVMNLVPYLPRTVQGQFRRKAELSS